MRSTLDIKILTGYTKPVTVATLANGFTIIHIPSKKKVSRVSLYIATGSLDDGPRLGVAHFLEHLVAGPAHSGGENPRIAEFKFRNGLINSGASTSKHFTVYHGRTSTEHGLTFAKTLLREVFHPEIHKRAVELEVGVIRSEILRSNVSSMLHESVFNQLVPSYPECHHTPAGHVDTVESMTDADLISHHETFYTAGRSLLCYMGSMTADQLFTELAPIAEEIACGNGMPNRRIVLSPERNGEISIANARIQSPGFEIHMQGAPVGAERVRYSLYRRFLIDFQYGLLYKRLRHERQLAYALNASHYNWPICIANIEVDGLKTEIVSDVRDMVVEIMDSITEATFTPELLNYFKTEYLLYTADDTKKPRIGALASHWILGILDQPAEDDEAIMAGLTAANLIETHRDTWGAGSRFIIEFQPST